MIIVREWVQVFLKTFLGLYFLISNANIISEVSRGMVSFDLILIHHLLDTPRWLLKILPVACLMASLFALNNLRRRNELVAIFASGFPLRAFVITLAQLGMAIGLLQFLMGAYIEPFSKHMRPYLMKGNEIHFRVNKSKGVSTTFGGGRLWYRGPNYYAAFKAFNKSKLELLGVTYYFYDSEKEGLSKILHAKKAIYLKDNIWEFQKVEQLAGLEKKEFTLLKTFKELPMVLKEKPEDFRYLEADISKLNIIQLGKYISNLENLGIKTDEYQVMFFQIFSQALLCLLFTLTPLFALWAPNRRSSSFGKNVFVTVVFVVCFWLLYSVSLSYGSKGDLTPWLGAFLIPLILGLFVFANLFRHKSFAS